jgi:hypothetical protein
MPDLSHAFHAPSWNLDWSGGTMNSSKSAQKSPWKWSALFALLMASVVASADDSKDKKPASSPSPRPARSTPSKTATPRTEGRKTEHGAARTTEGDSDRGTKGARERGTPSATGTGSEHGTARPTGGASDHVNPPAPRTHTEREGARARATHGTTPATTPASGTEAAHGTATLHPAPSTTTREFKSATGQRVQANYRDGRVRSIQAPSMRIDHDLHGDRRIVTERNGRRIVTVGPHMGYSQRSYYNRGSRAYVQRTYFMGGHRYAYAYRTYYYGGVHYYGYAPAYYYRPAYYGWVYNPWRAPVRYRWGWDDQPWYGYYGSYFAPYGVYGTASLWLTDYILSESLRAAYESRAYDRSLDAMDSPPAREEQLDPDVKESIAYEVKRQIAAEQAAANSEAGPSGGDEAPPALDSKSKIFVVASDLDTTMSTGQECALTPGDVLLRTNAEADDDNRVDVTVASSKKGDCFAGSTVSVEVADLQEMHNHLRQLLDTGLKTLADNSGRNGLPSAPDTTTRAGEVPPPEVDANVETDLQEQLSDADRIEREAAPQD